jgi:LysR family transcriptional activator of nhaA
MSHLNFNHLYYFWVVAREGSITRAAGELHVTPQTISGQLKTLEARLGIPLFRKVGRTLQLTEMGQLALSYVRPMFQLGHEFCTAVQAQVDGQAARASLGVESSVPRSLALRLLAPALRANDSSSVGCYFARRDSLFTDLIAHRADIVLVEGPPSTADVSRVHSIPVAESGLSFFVARSDVSSMARRFPQCLSGADMLAPLPTSGLGNAVFRWREQVGINPNIVAELDDSILMCELAESGAGFFVQPTEIEDQILRRYDVGTIGRLDTVALTYYAVHLGSSYTNALIGAMDAHIGFPDSLPEPGRLWALGSSAAVARSERTDSRRTTANGCA